MSKLNYEFKETPNHPKGYTAILYLNGGPCKMYRCEVAEAKKRATYEAANYGQKVKF